MKPAVADVVKAKRFEVVDAAESPRAMLTMTEHGSPSLGLHDAAGEVIWKAP